MNAARAAGWHGKLPTVGDFATRRLDAAFVEAWDDWLSNGLATLRLNADWLPAYLASPSWRFVLMPGVLPGSIGEQAWAGVLMPSVDRVGRYYPLTLAQSLRALPATGADADALWRWLTRLDDAAVDALHEDWTLDALETEIHRIGEPVMAGATIVDVDRSITDPLRAQLSQLWCQGRRGRAYWYADQGRASPALLDSDGLNERELVAQLLGAGGGTH